jgi:hypothetical protein
MPTLETTDGRAVDVTTPDADEVNRQFAAAMASDGQGDQAPPKRTPRTADTESEVSQPKRGRPPKAEKARTTAKPAVVLSDADRASGVKGVAQVGAAFALLLGKVTGKDAFKADAVTIASSAEEIADACVQTAKADAKFAALIDKVCAAGPYAALISVGFSVGGQCARNHKPDLKIPGTVDPAELLKAQNEMEQANA